MFAGCAVMFIWIIRVRPTPYSILMTVALCVVRPIAPSNTQAKRMLVPGQESGGLSDVGRLRSASAAACPAAVNFTGGGNQPAGPAGIGRLSGIVPERCAGRHTP